MTRITKIFVPRDTSACALGADAIADQVAQSIQDSNLPLKLIRNGSRGMYWLEPMVEIEADGHRVAFGPVDTNSMAQILQSCPWELTEQERSDLPYYLGPTEEVSYLKNQQRLCFSRVGVIESLSLDDYQSHGGMLGLKEALNMSPSEVIDVVIQSGLRGRGGAAFPTGIKWKTVFDTGAEQKYIVCNADEGDSGTYSDRMLMESDPYRLIEGMLIAGLAVGADTGYVYLREEYPLAANIFQQAINNANEANILGENVCGSNKNFHLELRLAAGAYICGEETSLLESLEGKRGEVRSKPPLPAIKGLFGEPTVINNVITFASVPDILANGAAAYESYGVGRSKGTLPFQLAGNVKQAGLVELAFGNTLRELIEEFGGGTRTGKPIKAVQVGGPLGAYLSADQLDTALDYEAFAGIGAMLGHGGIVVFDEDSDMAEQARFAMEFCAIESCGKCTPCRIGSVRGVETIDKILAGDDSLANKDLLRDLCETMKDGSLCAMGGLTPYPVLSALDRFEEDFDHQQDL